jgi:hypothetical protein
LLSARFAADECVSGGKIRHVTNDLQPDLDARLRRVAVDLILPTGLRVDDAVRLAEDLVVSGADGEATIEVAALRRDSLGSDAEPLVRAMLSEHGIGVPVPADEVSEYRVLLRAFGYLDLPIHFVEWPFYARLPAWHDQGPLDRALVTLLDKRDHLTSPAERHQVEQEMRSVVRDHLAPDSPAPGSSSTPDIA